MSRKIVLINPPWFFKERVEFLSQNLAIGYLAGYLQKKGHCVEVIDALASGWHHLVDVQTKWGGIKRAGLPYDEILEMIPKETEIVGITAPFTHHGIIVRELSAKVKKAFPAATVILGGVYPSTMPENALTEGVDYIIKGEGEIPLAKIAGGEDPARIKGVWFRGRDGKMVANGTAEMIQDLDDIPYPARHLLPMDKYHRLSGRGRAGGKAATVITSRGCPFNCTFCSVHAVYGWKWRARSPQNIIGELKLLRDEFDIRHIEFEDDNLTLDIRRAEEIFDGMIGLGLTWSCSNGIRIDKLDRELLIKIKESGCRVLNLGIEHGDPEMLEMMNKKLDLGKVEDVISICLELEIPTVGFWVICHPGETRERFERGLEFFRKLKDRGMYGFGVHLAWPMPGTRLFEMCEENGWLVHPDVAERLIFPGPFYIECPEFDAKEASKRLERAKTVLGVDDGIYSGSKISEFLSVCACICLGYRWLKVSPVRLGHKYIRGFYPPETTPDGHRFQWSNPNSSVTIRPVSHRVGKMLVNMLSIAEKQMTIIVNSTVVYDGLIKNGNNALAIELGGVCLQNSRMEIEFITPPTIPGEIETSSKDLRELGVIIHWLKLL